MILDDSCVLGMNPPLVGSIVFDGRRMDILEFRNKPLECEYPFAIYGHDLASRKQYIWAATSPLRMSNIKAIRWGHDVPPATVQFFEVDQHWPPVDKASTHTNSTWNLERASLFRISLVRLKFLMNPLWHYESLRDILTSWLLFLRVFCLLTFFSPVETKWEPLIQVHVWVSGRPP